MILASTIGTLVSHKQHRTTPADRVQRYQKRRQNQQQETTRFNNSEKTPSTTSPSPSMTEQEESHQDFEQKILENNQTYQVCKMIGNRIEKFTGHGDRTFEEFLEEFVDLTTRFAIPLPVARRILPLFLIGGARLKFQQIPNHDTLCWKDLVTELAKRFKSQALLSNIRDELHNMTQGKDNVGEFARKVYNKTKTAFQGQGEHIVPRMAIDFFIKGLNPEIKKAIRRLPETEDFETIVSNAEKESRILEQERREDREGFQVVNALIADDKINRLEQQLNRLKMTSRRPPTPHPLKNRQPRSNSNQQNTNRKPFRTYWKPNFWIRPQRIGFQNRPPLSFQNRSRPFFYQQPRCTCGTYCPQHANNQMIQQEQPSSSQQTSRPLAAPNVNFPGTHFLCIFAVSSLYFSFLWKPNTKYVVAVRMLAPFLFQNLSIVHLQMMFQ